MTKSNSKKGSRSKKPVNKYNNDEIKEKLEGYEKLEKNAILTLPINTHVRYVTIKDGKQLFRTGGFLKQIHADKGYIMLANTLDSNYRNNAWSVQLKNTTFFKKISKEDIIMELKNENEKLRNEISKLKKLLKKIKKEI